eukprot:CAMPEP_0183353552 /NCGR_PEP_ID=MMETSP0164_2-20130417/33616_1 /TAXON_ID=221442 /ORGANISM="Coccolithus pelagicus ssp braarudi, Strain PLY182g" /LENGTH=60 /DNA_ID=CAMNT_0025526235 /DNA_START=57 /DNA_END=239 /DNA_ORIENTATION=+
MAGEPKLARGLRGVGVTSSSAWPRASPVPYVSALIVAELTRRRAWRASPAVQHVGTCSLL